MAINPAYLFASDKTGNAVIAHIQAPRQVGSTTISVDSVSKWPSYFIATTGTINASGVLDPASVTEFKGHLSGTNLIIDSFQPGYVDSGNTISQVVVLKQTTGWANDLAQAVTDLQSGVLVNDWTSLPVVPTVVSNNGNGEYTLKYAGVDYSDRLQPGTNLKLPRVTAPPTQSMAFASASSQYAVKSAPTGFTFTGPFTVEALIYVNAITSANQCIVSRWDGTNGFVFYVNNNGQLFCQVGSAGGATQASVISTQQVPVGKWVHVAVAMTPSTSGGTAFINGLAVPSTGNGTATTFTQAGNLMVGAYNSAAPAGFFDGKIAEVRVWTGAQTTAQIQANMGINLTGSETNLVGLWQGNGDFTDKTPNANTLTASGGATATSLGNPFRPNEFAKATVVSYASPDTTVTVYAGQYFIPATTQSTTSYSSAAAPFGMNNTADGQAIAAYDPNTTPAQIKRMIAAGISNPVLRLGYINTASAGGTMWLSVSGTRRTVDFTANQQTAAANSQATFVVQTPLSFIIYATSLVYSYASVVQSVTNNYLLGNAAYNPTNGQFSYYIGNATASPGVGGIASGQLAGY